MGRQHLRVLNDMPQFEVVAVADPRRTALSMASRNHPDVELCEETEGLLHFNLEAVVVASPTTAHAEQVELFLGEGLHVLVEKPISSNVNEAKHLGKLAASAGRTLLVGHVERFNPAVTALRSVIGTGRLGELMSATARRVGVARPTRPSANVICDLAIHDIDVIHFLTGISPNVVGAKGGCLPGNSMEDFACVLLAYGDTAAVVEANWITPLKDRRLNLTGTGGFVELDYIRQKLTMYEGQADVVTDSDDLFNHISQTVAPNPLFVKRGEPLRLELIHFYECIKSTAVPAVSFEDALAALACCERATEIVRQNLVDEKSLL